MIKEALQYLIGLGNAQVANVGDQKFSTQPLHLIQEAYPNAINVRSLSGLVEYLKSEFDGEQKMMVHVVSPTQVVAFSTYNRDFNRNQYIKAEAMLPELSFGRWHEAEEFNIKMQSCYVPNEDQATILKVVGNIQEDNVKTTGDDGVSQTVVAKTGIAQVGSVKVPNPVVLKPYRTFVEVSQPESEFVFRMQSGPKCALFEADGGAWKLEAMQRIKQYLQDELQAGIEAGKLVIIA